MKKQYRIIDTGKGILNINTNNLQEIENSNVTVTGGTYNSNSGEIIFENNDNGNFTVSGITFNDNDTNTFLTGGTYNSNTGNITFESNDGDGFLISGITFNDTFITGGTLNNEVISLTNNNNELINISGFTNSGFKLVDEGNGNGFVLNGLDRTPSNIVDVGLNSVDATSTPANSQEGKSGVSGQSAFGIGEGVLNDGYGSIAMGFDVSIDSDSYTALASGENIKLVNSARGTTLGFGHNVVNSFSSLVAGSEHNVTGATNGTGYNFITGRGNVNTGTYTNSFGTSLINKTAGTTVIGHANTDYIGGTNYNSSSNPTLIVGNGSLTTDSFQNGNVRSDSLILRTNGELTLPSTDINTIINGGNKSVTTLEYVNSVIMYNNDGTLSSNRIINSGGNTFQYDAEIPDYGISLLEGNDGYIEYGDIRPQATDNFIGTIVFSLQNLTNNGPLLGRHDGQNGFMIQTRSSGDVNFLIKDLSNFNSFSANLTTDTKYTLTYNMSGSSLNSLIINGTEYVSTPIVFSDTASVDYDNDGTFATRGVNSLYSNLFTGTNPIDARGDLTIFSVNFNLNGTEYNWDFQENGGNIATESTGNGVDATIFNLNSWVSSGGSLSTVFEIDNEGDIEIENLNTRNSLKIPVRNLSEIGDTTTGNTIVDSEDNNYYKYYDGTNWITLNSSSVSGNTVNNLKPFLSTLLPTGLDHCNDTEVDPNVVLYHDGINDDPEIGDTINYDQAGLKTVNLTGTYCRRDYVTGNNVFYSIDNNGEIVSLGDCF